MQGVMKHAGPSGCPIAQWMEPVTLRTEVLLLEAFDLLSSVARLA